MASAGVVNELNTQLEKRSKNNTSEAEKINVVESSADAKKDEASAATYKKKSKGGIFGKFKKLVKRPTPRKKDNPKENGQAQDNIRTKSTSDLVYEPDKTASPEHDSRKKRGISLLFDRKWKGRSSSKSKGKTSGASSKSSSEPVSPSHQEDPHTSPSHVLDAKEREELEVINKKLADDSFFQVSLTSDTQDASILSDVSTKLGDFGAMGQTSPGIGQQNVAQDRIRLAPKGRRKPARFNSKTDATEKGLKGNKAEKSPKPEKVARALKEKPATTERPDKGEVAQRLEKVKKPEIPQKPLKSDKGGNLEKASKADKLDETDAKTDSPTAGPKNGDQATSVGKQSPFVKKKPLTPNQNKATPTLELPPADNSPKLDLSDTVIIQTPKETTAKDGSMTTSTPIKDDFGSWEHLTGATPIGTNSKVKETTPEPVRSKSDSNPEVERVKNVSGEKNLKDGKTTLGLEKDPVNNSDREHKKETVDEMETAEQSMGKEILDLIEGKTEKSKEVKEKMKEDEKASPAKEKVVKETKNNDKENLSSAFDALVSRTRRLSEEHQKISEMSKKEVTFNDKKVELDKTNKKNWSFDLEEIDDMRSADLRPMAFQRSYSMSAAVKENGPTDSSKNSPPELAKWSSLDDTVTCEGKNKDENALHSKNKDENALHSTPNGKLPDWVSIAKAKHKRNASEEEEEDDATLEETMEEIKDIAAQIAQPDAGKSPPPMKDKPVASMSKIPKLSFKSQSMKGPSSTSGSATAGTKLHSRGSVSSSKVSSPASTCLVCSKPAYQFERCDVDGKVIHKNCARCSMCSRTINVGTIRVINDKLYCGIHARSPVS